MTESEDTPGSAASPRLLVGLASVALVLTACVFARGLSGTLVYDDLYTVGQNPVITSLSNIPQMFTRAMWDFTGPESLATVGFWRPLANVVLAIGWQMGGKDPLPYHVLSLLLHLAATAVAFRLALRLSRSAPVAFFAALLFGVHPLHVESVSWISAINDPLFGLFVLLSVDAWASWRERGSAGMPWRAGAWFLLGLLSKELAAAVVPIVLAYDLVHGHLARLGERWRPVAREYAPLLAALGLVYVARVGVFGGLGAGFARVTTDFGVGLARLVVLRVEILGGLLAACAWPFDLQVFPVFVPAPSWSQLVRPITAIAGWIVALIAARAWMTRSTLFAILFAPAAVSPMLWRVGSLGLFPVSGRYAYLALFGATLVVPMLVIRILPRAAACVALGALVLVFAAQSRARIAVWKDDVTLLTTAAAESPRSPFAHGVLGDALLQRYNREKRFDDLVQAHEAFQRALDLAQAAQQGDETIFAASADFVRADIGLAWTLVFEAKIDSYHDYETPATLFRMVTTRYPASIEAWTGLGVAELEKGDLDKSEAALKHALELDARHAQAHRYLGEIRAKRGDWDGARRAFEDALRARPDQAEYMLLLATEYARAGDDARASELYRRAAAADPKSALPHVKLGILSAKHADLEGALAELELALKLEPDDGEAWLEKGRVYLARGEKSTALHAFERASDAWTDSFDAHYNAGALHLEKGELSAAIPYLARAYESRPANASGRTLRDTLLELPIQSSDVLLDLAATDADRKDPDGALEWIAKALVLRPDEGRAHFLKGGVLRMKGDKLAALPELEKAAQAMPESLMAQQANASALLEAGNREAALVYFERALAIAQKAEGKSSDARNAIEALRAKIEEVKRGAK